MSKKILIMGKHTIERNQWGPLRELLGMQPDDKTKIELVNVPITHVLTHDEVKQYNLILSTQPNPIVLRRVVEIANKVNVTVIKPFKNPEGVITHFMKVNEVIVEYKYDLVKISTSEKKDVQNKKPMAKKPMNKKPEGKRNFDNKKFNNRNNVNRKSN